MHTNTLFTQGNSLLIINMLQTPNFLSTRSWEFVDKKLTSCMGDFGVKRIGLVCLKPAIYSCSFAQAIINSLRSESQAS